MSQKVYHEHFSVVYTMKLSPNTYFMKCSERNMYSQCILAYIYSLPQHALRIRNHVPNFLTNREIFFFLRKPAKYEGVVSRVNENSLKGLLLVSYPSLGTVQ